MTDVDERAVAWAASGAMALTGRADGQPLGAPAALMDLVESATATIERRSDRRVMFDGLALLGERAALGQLRRNGAISCGGGTRLLRAVDGWLAVSLPRPEDVEALPAWLDLDIADEPSDARWAAITDAVAGRTVETLDERAALLGLPVAAVGSVSPPSDSFSCLPVTADDLGGAPPLTRLEGLTVIDLSSLWAGPLCGQILAAAGTTVVKVESRSRPDMARVGMPELFDLLNQAKRSVALDLRTSEGVAALTRLVTTADIVIESSRPRALEQLGIMASDMVTNDGPRVWVSITAQGRAPGRRDRVAFGDVAAAAGGLVTHDQLGPCFCADAIADPLAGLVAAAAVFEALAQGGRWQLDVGMAPVAASASGPSLDVEDLVAAIPRSRSADGPAPPFGADTETVLHGLRP